MAEYGTVSSFDEVHKMANDIVNKDGESLRIPFVNYTQVTPDTIVLAIVPGPCPDGYESKLRNLIDRGIGFKCTIRESDATLIVATYVLDTNEKDANGCTVNNCEFALPNDNEAIRGAFERLIDETTASIKVH